MKTVYSLRSHSKIQIIGFLIILFFVFSMIKSFNSDTSRSVNLDIQENINDAINGFNGGFIENIKQKSEHIKFYVQSRSISVGFSKSMMQYVLSFEIDTVSI